MSQSKPTSLLSAFQENKENFNSANVRMSTRKREKPFQEMSCSQLSTCEKVKKIKEPKEISLTRIEARNSHMELQNSKSEQTPQMKIGSSFNEESQGSLKSIKGKRAEKVDRKQVSPKESQYVIEELREPIQQAEQRSAETGVHPEDQIEPSRKTEQESTLQIKNQDHLTESLMDATYHSQASATGQGVQFQGRWTQEEHDRFIEGLTLFGKDWRLIEEHIGSRSCAQIRSHAQKFFNKKYRDQAKAQGTYQKSVLGKRPRREEAKIQIQPEVKETEIIKLPKIIEEQTNQQVQQIQETLEKLAEDDILIQLRSLIAQREHISLEVLTKKTYAEDACRQLIQITNSFHQLAMKSLSQNNCKQLIWSEHMIVEICNRMIDERNLSQFICILLSKQITVLPDTSASNNEVIQHVHTVSMNSQNSIQTYIGEKFHSENLKRDSFRSYPVQTPSIQRMNLSHGNEMIKIQSSQNRSLRI